MRVRDKLWLWGHPAGSHNGIYNVPGDSRITPVEAAHYLGIPNLIAVNYVEYGPFPPFDQFALPMHSLDQVVWSIVGASGETDSSGRDEVLELARRMPNITGVMMDDFFNDPGAQEGGAQAALPLDEVQEVRRRLKLGDRTVDLWVVLYDRMLSGPATEYLDLCDVVTFWTWEAQNLSELESNFDRFERVAAKQRKVLGCYMWEYGNSKPMPMDLMQKQTEFGLEMLRAGRIDGMIFLASCICDLGLETVEWTRERIASVGAAALPERQAELLAWHPFDDVPQEAAASITPLRIVTGQTEETMAARMDISRVGVCIPVTCSPQWRVRMVDTWVSFCTVHRTGDHAVHLSEPFQSRARFRWSNLTEQY